MMSEKHIFNYPTADGGMISFRESMADFAPKKGEFIKLRGEIVETIGKETTPEFDNILDYLITLLRHKIFIHKTSASVTDSQKQLSILTRHLKKLQTFLNEDLTFATQRHLSYRVLNKMTELECEDPLFTLYENTSVVLDICEETQKSIKGKKPDFTATDMRQILAEELARELDKIGIEPKKYRDGDFVNILRAILAMIPCKINGHRISISIPSDLFKIACKAIDDFPQKAPFSLLSFK